MRYSKSLVEYSFAAFDETDDHQDVFHSDKNSQLAATGR
jgi:hypothetical protein